MATNTNISTECERCQGTGIHTDKGIDGQPDINENPCVACGGLGYIKSGVMDVTAITEALGYIHGKVTAIWNKVKNL